MSNQLDKPIFSTAKKHRGLYYLSGQIGVDSATGEFAGSDIQSQTVQIAKNIENILIQYGMGMENILKATCYITDMEVYAQFNEAYAKVFVSCPVRTCIAVKTLPFHALCEIEVIASEEVPPR